MRIKIAILALIGLFLFSILGFAQEGKVIYSISVKNNKAISEATILSKIKTKPGDRFSQDVMNDDLKRLYALGYFTDVSIDVQDYKEGIMVAIVVEEKPLVANVLFEGNKKISARRLQKSMQTKSGEMLNYSTLAQDINELKALYTKYGFQMVDVKYEINVNKEENTADIIIKVDEKQRVRIKKIRVEGNKAVKTNVILSMMKTKPAWLFARGYLDEEALDADIEKIKRYYQDLGYLDIAVTSGFSQDKDNNMIIALTITEGKKYTTGKIYIKGNLVFPPEEIKKKISMKEGEFFSYSSLRKDMESIREYYYQKGYMNVEIDVERKINPDTCIIDLGYEIQAHDIVYVGRVDIKGNIKTKDIIIRRELRIYPGERFDGDRIRRSKERLYNLGFFEDVLFETEETGEPNVRNLVISVKETKTGEFAFGGGYSSVDSFLGFVQITQRNFDLFNFPYFTGDGQQLSIRANIGTIRSDYDLSWTEPWIFDYPLSFGFDAYHRTHSRDEDVGYGYKEVRAGGDVRLGKEFNDYFRADLMYKLENVNITDLADNATIDLSNERGDNWLSTIMFGMAFDTRDNIYVPKRGFLTQLALENTGGILGFDKTFYKAFFNASFYYPFFEVIVLELKARAGLAASYGNTDEVPIYERFYAGGGETIRGYAERKVGPRDPGSSEPIGGETMIIGNAEITFPIYEKVIKGAIFYDVGNVWRHVEDSFTDGVKMGVGCGIRVKTPIGPLKLDCGYPLSDNQHDEKKLEWYFSVSHGF